MGALLVLVEPAVEDVVPDPAIVDDDDEDEDEDELWNFLGLKEELFMLKCVGLLTNVVVLVLPACAAAVVVVVGGGGCCGCWFCGEKYVGWCS